MKIYENTSSVSLADTFPSRGRLKNRQRGCFGEMCSAKRINVRPLGGGGGVPRNFRTGELRERRLQRIVPVPGNKKKPRAELSGGRFRGRKQSRVISLKIVQHLQSSDFRLQLPKNPYRRSKDNLLWRRLRLVESAYP